MNCTESFLTSKNTGLEYFVLSNHKSCQKLYTTKQPMVFLCLYWKSDICWQVDILSAKQEMLIVPSAGNGVSKISWVECRQFFSLPSPLIPSLIIFWFNLIGSAFTPLYLFLNQPLKEKKIMSYAG